MQEDMPTEVEVGGKSEGALAEGHIPSRREPLLQAVPRRRAGPARSTAAEQPPGDPERGRQAQAA